LIFSDPLIHLANICEFENKQNNKITKNKNKNKNVKIKQNNKINKKI
jgi:hypothetical protein